MAPGMKGDMYDIPSWDDPDMVSDVIMTPAQLVDLHMQMDTLRRGATVRADESEVVREDDLNWVHTVGTVTDHADGLRTGCARRLSI